jgi:hypothetical protein
MSNDQVRALQAFHDAHGGVVQARVIRRQDAPALLLAATTSDEDSLVALRCLEEWMRDMHRRKKPDRFLCLCCDACFHPRQMPEAFLVITPFAAASSAAVVTGICPRCASRDNAALALAGLRSVYPHATLSDGGRA